MSSLHPAYAGSDDDGDQSMDVEIDDSSSDTDGTKIDKGSLRQKSVEDQYSTSNNKPSASFDHGMSAM